MNTTTGDLLHQEHETTLATLQRFEQLLVRQGNRSPLDPADSAARSVLQTVAATLANEVGRHFAFEEEHLFPLLAENGEDAIADFLSEEHETIRELAREIGAAIPAALADGFDAAGWRRFHAAGLELVEREIYHIQKEEMALLAAISSLVEPDRDAELAAQYRALQG